MSIVRWRTPCRHDADTDHAVGLSQDDLLFTRIAPKRSGLDCEVIEIERAEKALEVSGTDPLHGVDLILMDINMPGMDGIGFLVAFEALSASWEVAVAMLTSSSDPSDQRRASLHRSVQAILNKPLTRFMRPPSPR